HYSSALVRNANTGGEVAHVRDGAGTLAVEHGADEAVDVGAEADLLRGDVVSTQKGGHGRAVLALQRMTSSYINQELAAPLDEARWELVGVDVAAAADGVAAVMQLDGHLDAVDSDVGGAEDAVDISMVGAEQAARGTGFAHEFPGLGLVALA